MVKRASRIRVWLMFVNKYFILRVDTNKTEMVKNTQTHKQAHKNIRTHKTYEPKAALSFDSALLPALT